VYGQRKVGVLSVDTIFLEEDGRGSFKFTFSSSRGEMSGRVNGQGVPMTNILEQAINSNDGDRAAKIIQEALGIENDDVVNYCFPKTWPEDRQQRAHIIGFWLESEAPFLA
jgi:hypothetical protein